PPTFTLPLHDALPICLNSDMLLNLHTQALRAHPRARPRRVRHIDRIDAQLVQLRRAIQLLAAVDAINVPDSPRASARMSAQSLRSEEHTSELQSRVHV